jgi:hypothetical protein
MVCASPVDGPERSAGLTADPRPETGSAWALVGAGLDTVSFAWTDDSLAARIAKRAGDDLTDAVTGEVVSLRPVKRGVMTSAPLADGGWHFGAYPTAGMVFVEGRLAPMLSGATVDRRLVAASELGAAVDLAGARLARLIAEPVGPVRIRRADLAADVRFSRAEDGLSMLRALATLDVPRYKLDVWRHDGRQVETIYLRTRSGRVRARIYDKARERGETPGTLVRAEYQHQPTGAKRPAVAAFIESDAGLVWERAFGRWSTSTSTLTAGTLGAQQQGIIERARAGALTGRVAERLLGTLALFESGAAAGIIGERAAARRRSELRSLGITVEENLAGTFEVGAVLAAIRSALAPADS